MDKIENKKHTHFCFKTKMSVQVYSRDYLQSMPEERKQQQIDRIVSGFIRNLKEDAALGKTSYTYTNSQNETGSRTTYIPLGHANHSPFQPQLTDADLIAGFFTRFPGCKVYYQEEWVESGPTTRVLKKGIVIDWS